jgi:hypothetical protein
MSVIDAFHLPGLDERDVDRWDTRTYGISGVTLRFPVLHDGAMTRLVARLLAARAAGLAALPVHDIARAIDQAARRLRDPAHPLRRLAEYALPAVTGYSLPMIRLVLDRAPRDWMLPALEALLQSELAGGELLDRFVRRSDGRSVRAVGPRFAWHVFAGNVPGVAVTSLVRSLLVRAATLGKTAADEPLLAVLFARALEEVAPSLAACIAVMHWPGGRSTVEDELLRAADLVVVYGGEAAVRALRARAPATARVVEHGPRVSVGLVARNALKDEAAARETAGRVAWAVSVFDQQGCVSPHVVWVESGARVTPRRFAELLGEGLATVARELPRGSLSAAEAAAIHEVRTATEFRAIAGEDAFVVEGQAAGWTVLWEGDPRFEPSCLNRTIRVKPVAHLEDVPALLEPVRGLVQSAAVEGAGTRLPALAADLANAGVTRITDFPQMPWPPPSWHHDGAGPLTELVRWVDLEL